ncbi:hypothetical protein TRIP_C90189 [Candidatus Zixiibacteriota bacterium]|nr:hypothetical protein TRIP_C90189 [candidate division Zixibacteria bacterium]
MNLARTIIFLTLSTFLIGRNPAMGTVELRLPQDVFYDRPASAVMSPEAIWVNPASITHDSTAGFQYMGEVKKSSWFKNWGIASTGNGLGIAYRHLKNFEASAFEEYIFAAGAEIVRGLNWGGSYRYIRKGPASYNRRHLWNLALYMRRSRDIALAAVFENLNRGEIEGQKSAVVQRYAFSYYLLQSRVILSIEARTATGRGFSDADYLYTAEYFSTKNWDFFAAADNAKSYQFGVRYTHGYYTYGVQSRIAHNDGPMTNIFFIEYRPAWGRGRR